MSIGPDFLFIGGSRCGSTWLSKHLQSHQDIWVVPIKEISYFNFEGRSALSSRKRKRAIKIIPKVARECLFQRERPLQDIGWFYDYFKSSMNDEWYQQLFPKNRGSHKGELTPTYMCVDMDAIKRIHTMNPNLKVIMMLREPVERSWSLLGRRYRFTDNQSISEVPVADIISRIEQENSIPFKGNNSNYARRSLIELNNYSGAYQNWSTIFGTENVFIGHFEQIKNEPQVLINMIFEFLGVCPFLEKEKIKLAQRVNQATENKSIDPPEELKEYLIELYAEEINKCSKLFGSWCESWATSNS